MPVHPIQIDISRFYHRWHAYESTLGSDNGNILDLDYCPREYLKNLEDPYENRLKVLEALEPLQDHLNRAPPGEFSNFEYLTHRLRGSMTYLRCLMGEKINFHSYIEATTGITPSLFGFEYLASLRAELEEALGRKEISLIPEHQDRFRKISVEQDSKKFVQDLQREGPLWMTHVHKTLELPEIPPYEMEFVEEDAYWVNWLTGSIGNPMVLKINNHPRHTFYPDEGRIFASHELGGHALHNSGLFHSSSLGHLDPAALNTTMHGCDTFHFEGIAMSVFFLLPKEEISDEALIAFKILFYHVGILNEAQVKLEEGQPFPEVLQQVLKAAPFMKPLKALSDLRDRMRNPMDRCYQFVYYPAATQFLKAIHWSLEKRVIFLKKMYSQLYTPSQIASYMNFLEAEGKRIGPIV